MSQYDGKFPTRDAPTVGSSREREMLDAVGGAKGVRTRVFTDSIAGTTTTLRTRGGSPEFLTEVIEEEPDELGPPRGLVAYPTNAYESGWMKPAVIGWDADHQRWVPVIKKIPLLKEALQTLPAWGALQVVYHLDEKGNTSIPMGKKLFFGLAGAKNMYRKWKAKDYTGDGTPKFAFQGPTVQLGQEEDRFFVVTDDDGHQVLRFSSGDLLREFAPTRNIGGGDKPFTLQPPSATTDGTTVCLNGSNATNWGVPVEGFYEAQPEKEYRWEVISLPGMVVQSGSSMLHCYSKFDGTWAVTGGTDTNVGNVGDLDCLSVCWIKDTFGHSGYIWAGHAGYPGIYAPMMAITVAEKVDTNKSNALHQYLDRAYDLDLNASTKVGVVPVRGATVAVEVLVQGRLDQKIHAEGKVASGSPIAPNIDPNGPLAGPACIGEAGVMDNQRRMQSSNNDAFSVVARVGEIQLELFKHSSTSSGQASIGKRVTTISNGAVTGFSWNTYSDLFDGAHLDASSGGQGADASPQANGLCPHNVIQGYPYVIFNGAKYHCDNYGELEAAIAGAETTSAKYNEGGKTGGTTETSTPYAGSVNFAATSRNVIAFDPELKFLAYIEIHISSACTYSSPADSWLVAPGDNQLRSQHTVTAKLVIQCLGTEHSKDLFTETFSKMGPWYRQQVIDYRGWPWPMQAIEDLNYTVQGPRIWPDVNKYTSVDKFFVNQGVCPDLAGISQDEISTNLNDDPKTKPVSTAPEVIFAKRFKFVDIDCNWIFADYAVSEGKRTPNISDPDAGVPYFYCPALGKRVLEDYYQVEFEMNASGARFRVWTDDFPAEDPAAPKLDPDQQSANCFRV